MQILYVILNGELKMSPGKAAAQAVHAASLIDTHEFIGEYKRSVVVLEAKSTAQIRNLYEYLNGAGIDCAYYIDEGVNEVEAYSITALAIEPIDSEDKEKREILEAFPLFTGKGDKYQDAYEALEVVTRGFRRWDGDNTPRFMRKTLEWLGERSETR